MSSRTTTLNLYVWVACLGAEARARGLRRREEEMPDAEGRDTETPLLLSCGHDPGKRNKQDA